LIAVVLVLAVVACDSEATTDTTVTTVATVASTTTSTIEGDTCDRVGDDAVVYLERVIDTLDETSLRELSDPASWGDELRQLQSAGRDLDTRASAMRCSVAVIQGRVFAEADLDPGGRLSARLVELLLAPTIGEATTDG
jgi:hypothetical protein